MASIDPIYITTTFILRYYDEREQGSATGFFFLDDNDKIYLVTNKHVIYGEKYFENPSAEINKLKLLLHIDANNLSLNEKFDVDLFEKEKKVWFEHTDPKIDVVLIPLNIDRKKYIFAHIDKSLIKYENILIKFEKIFVIGYPYGWFDKVNNLPVTRIGHLSSPFKVSFRGEPIMLGDVETHLGMSGGPVFMELNDYTTIEGDNRTKHLGKSKIILVGIHSGQPRWDLIDKNTGKIKETISHSLINIWFADLILDILRINKANL